jgi:E3 Ubiquitin ligase
VTVCLLSFIPINHLTILSALAIVGGLYFFFVGFRLLARKRLLLSTPTSKIRSAAMGLVEVNGMAAGPYTMPAPITGKPCFLYHTTVWQQRADKEKEWEKVADETLHLPFFVDDSTGQLLIEPLGADLDLRREYREEYDTSFFSSGLNNVPPRVSVFFARHNLVPTRSLRVEERVIKLEDPLFIAGTLSENPGVQVRPLISRSDSQRTSTPNFFPERTRTPEVIQLSSGPAPTSTRDMSQQSKIAAALTRAGITKPEAWSAAGVPYLAIAVEENELSTPVAVPNPHLAGESPHAEQPKPSEFNLTPPVVLMKGTNDPTFVISFRSQKEFVVALAWKSAAMIWGGAAITLLGVYMLLAQMQLDWL